MIGLRIEKEPPGFWTRTFMPEAIEQTRKDLLSPLARVADRFIELARRKLSVRGGPSRPGEPPALNEGMLRDGIGRTGPYSDPGTVEIAWGFGVGEEAMRRIEEHASRRGESVGEMFAIANLHEAGGVGADGRRFPPRAYIRPTEEELSAQVDADLQRAVQ